MPVPSQTERLLKFIRDHGVIRARDLAAMHVPRVVLQRLAKRGQIARRSRGVYASPDHEATRHTDLAEVSMRP